MQYSSQLHPLVALPQRSRYFRQLSTRHLHTCAAASTAQLTAYI